VNGKLGLTLRVDLVRFSDTGVLCGFFEFSAVEMKTSDTGLLRIAR
jgi:hypothetical protein